MNDIELHALTVLVETQGRVMEWTNEQRRNQGYSLAYDDEVLWPAQDAMRDELIRRGLIATTGPAENEA